MILHSPAVLTKKVIPTTAEIIALVNAVSGFSGIICDPTNLANLFQLSGGTTAVTAVTDPVGYCADLSGNGRNATQATAGNRPTYNRINEARGLLFDGSNDSLTYASTGVLTNKSSGTIIGAVRFSATGALGRMFHIGTNSAGSSRLCLDKDASDRLLVVGRKLDADTASSLISSDAITNGWHVVAGVHDYVNNIQKLEIDNRGMLTASAATWDTGGSVTSNTASNAIIMGQTGSGAFYAGYIGRHLLGAPMLPPEVYKAVKRWAGGGFGAVI